MFRLLATIAMALAGSTIAVAQHPIKPTISTILRSYDFDGVVVISPDNQGWANLEWDNRNGIAMTADEAAVPWRWASVTKQMIAILVMQEVERGRIDLDKAASVYLPNFSSPNADTVTVRQLMQHQSGLPNPSDHDGTSSKRWAFFSDDFSGSRDPATGFCAGPVKGAPGDGWSYNNCDYMVLGALLEEVAGLSWQELFNREIAIPLGLKSTGAFASPTYPGDQGTRIGWVRGRREWLWDMSTLGASASMFGSAADLIAIDRALMDGRLLGEEALEQMWNGDPVLGYMAIGQWAYPANLKGCDEAVEIVERHGDMGATQVRNFILPDDGIAVVMFSQSLPFDYGQILNQSGFAYDILSATLCAQEQVQ